MKLKKSLTIAVKNYLKEVDSQSSIISTSHNTLIELVKIFGKKAIRAEINTQLEKER